MAPTYTGMATITNDSPAASEDVRGTISRFVRFAS
jgi:hypothetical protein